MEHPLQQGFIKSKKIPFCDYKIPFCEYKIPFCEYKAIFAFDLLSHPGGDAEEGGDQIQREGEKQHLN